MATSDSIRSALADELLKQLTRQVIEEDGEVSELPVPPQVLNAAISFLKVCPPSSGTDEHTANEINGVLGNYAARMKIPGGKFTQ